MFVFVLDVPAVWPAKAGRLWHLPSLHHCEASLGRAQGWPLYILASLGRPKAGCVGHLPSLQHCQAGLGRAQGWPPYALLRFKDSRPASDPASDPARLASQCE